jgi:hypothetical protein
MSEPTPADKAFTDSANKFLGATELHPYSASRAVAAQALGLIYPNVGTESLEQFHKTGMYPGAVQDVLIVLWLCSIPDKEVIAAMRKPDESLAKAIEWGATLKITLAGEEWWQAYQQFMNIMTEISESDGAPKLPEHDEDDGGPNE